MRKLVFATNNSHKLEEIRQILHNKVEIISLAEIGCTDDIAETADSLQGNALIKARYIYERYGLSCFADDTGLEVEALFGAPGVYSARYAGEHCSPKDNIVKLLSAMQGQVNRRASFRTVIALIDDGQEYLFEGSVLGHITEAISGTEGFGYDPIFTPVGYEKTFAELGIELKNSISHRAIAVQKLADWLCREV